MIARAHAGALLAMVLGLSACTDASEPIAVGTLERDRLDLVAESSEPLVERPFEEGAFVEAGSLIVKLDPARFEARAAQAAAARDRAAARLSELVRGPRHEQISEARAHLQGTEGRLVTARNVLARTKQLMSDGVTSQDVVDQRQASFDEALAARDAARASLDALLDGTTAEELSQAEAALAEADAMLREAQVQLGRLEIRAPAAGRIEALPFELGERPPAGAVVAIVLADESPYARVYVPASIRVHVRAGTPARVRVDGIEEPLAGRVRVVAGDASFTPYFALTERDRGRLVYKSKVDLIDERARELPTGLPVEVEFELGEPAIEETGARPRD